MASYIIIDKIFFSNIYDDKDAAELENMITVRNNNSLFYKTEKLLLPPFYTKILLKIIINKDDRYLVTVLKDNIIIYVSVQYLHYCISNYIIPDSILSALIEKYSSYIISPSNF